MKIQPANFILRVLSFAAIALAAGWAQGVDIYETDFESFAVGSDQLVGSEGWTGTNTGEGVHGIDDELVEGLGKTGFLGFAPPSTDFVSVAHPASYDPLTAGTPVIEFFALVGVSDSTNDAFDRFYISFYNGTDDLLGAVSFDNTPADFGLLRHDGSDLRHTGELFLNDTVQALFVSIDFSTNRWSAKLDGLPVFTDEPFNSSGVPLNLGSIAAEWEVLDAEKPGNNWLLFDEWTVTAKGDNQAPQIAGIPENLTVPTDEGQSTAVVQWVEPTASDNVTVTEFVSTHPSGFQFPVGRTTVTYSASDAGGNTASESFTVTVEDREPPRITGLPGNLTVTVAPDDVPTPVHWPAPTSADNVSVSEFTSNRVPGDSFPEGVTIVTYTARDSAGNERVDDFRVTVLVSTPPQSPYEKWLEEHFKTSEVDPFADADFDGLNNLFEFGIGTNPLLSLGMEGTSAAPKVKRTPGAGPSSFSLQFFTAPDLPGGVTLEVLQSAKLDNPEWEPVATRQGANPWSGPAVELGKLRVQPVNGAAKVLVELVETVPDSSDQRFYRLRMRLSPD